jgi:hypothetical protein
MDGSDDRPPDGPTGENPFPSTPVAQISESGTDPVTIPTGAVREAFGCLDAYLAATPTPGTDPQTLPGGVLAVVGDYGTGKTHLAMALRRRAQERAGSAVRTIYLDAPAGTFSALYRRFLGELDRTEIRHRVREYHAEILADSLRASELTAPVADRLDDPAVDPVDLIARSGHLETMFLERLQERLRRITDNEAFSSALTLLLRPEFEAAVWEWLEGHPPDPVLAERGIVTPTTASETRALEALGVFALLFGHRRHRLVLVIDELDKILLASDRPEQDVVPAFKKLLQVSLGAGAFLVLCGLPDLLQALGEDTRQRFSRVVQMSPLTGEDVRWFIEQSQLRVNRQARLEPFTVDTVGYLVRIAGGVPRKVIRLCHQLYRRAQEQRTGVTYAMVRQVAREADFGSPREVRAEIRRVLVADGWPYVRDHPVGPEGQRVDYWVPVGGTGAGCAVVLSEAVLNKPDAEALSQRARAIHTLPVSETLLVVVGYLVPELVAPLAESFRTEPVVYEPGSFADDFAASLKAMIRRVEQDSGEEPLAAIRDRVERINRQQASVHTLLEQLAVHQDTMRSAADRQLAALQQRLDAVSQALVARLGEGLATDPRARSRLPAELATLFDEPLPALDELGRVEARLREVFDASRQDSRQAMLARTTIRDRLQADQALLAVSVAALLHTLVGVFREAVEDWFGSYGTDSRGRLDPADRDRLGAVCRTFEAVVDYLPVHRLADLGSAADQPAGQPDLIEAAVWSARRPDVREVLRTLGARVRVAALRAVAGPPGPAAS